MIQYYTPKVETYFLEYCPIKVVANPLMCYDFLGHLDDFSFHFRIKRRGVQGGTSV